MDLALRNATIIDGSGGPRYRGDVGVTDGKIVAVGSVTGKATEEIDLAGAAICPGFIDVHTHYDAQALWDRMLSPSVYHGVTTVLAGNCGFTVAPLSGDPEDADYLLRMLSCVEGMPLTTLRAAVKPTWKSFGEYLDQLDGKLAINTVFLVGHSALRRAVMGERAVGHEATPEEIQKMCDLLDRSIREGGAGFSTTVAAQHIDYEDQPVPSRWASREELLALAAVAGKHPGTWLEMVTGKMAFDEDVYKLKTDMSVAAGRSLNWNLIVADASARKGVESQVHLGDYARKRGGAVYGLIPPIAIKATINFVSVFPLATIPNWSGVMHKPMDERLAAFADPAVRKHLIEGVAIGAKEGNPLRDWDDMKIEIVTTQKNKRWVGKTLGEYGKSVGKTPLEALFDLAVEEKLMLSISKTNGDDPESWKLRRALWTDDRCMIGGSDAGAHLDVLNTFAFSTQLLGEAVRDRGMLELEDAVRRITSLPADRFGLTGRGRLELGAIADLVVFDPATIACGEVTMRYDLPGEQMRLYAEPVGVSRVFVNGVCVAKDGESTGKLAGRVLRSGRDTHTVSNEPAMAAE